MKNVHKIIVCALPALVSCTAQRHSGWTSDRQPTSEAKQKELSVRAERFWSAKAAEDWDTVFDYQYEPKARAQLIRHEFCEWSKQNEPLRVHTYSLGKVIVDADLGWVQVEYKSSVRRYPALEPRVAHFWQKWHWAEGSWYPIPQQKYDNYPETPEIRDAAQEQRLRARFDETFRLRLACDWHHLYQYTDPRDRGDVSEEQYAEAESLFEYIEADVEWVEAVKDFGQVRVNYRHKLTDKSMEKLEAREAVLTERWILVDNQWYRDLKR